MPYSEAWPLIRSGAYPHRKYSLDNFTGCLEQKGGPRFTIAQIKKFTEHAWAAKR